MYPIRKPTEAGETRLTRSPLTYITIRSCILRIILITGTTTTPSRPGIMDTVTITGTHGTTLPGDTATITDPMGMPALAGVMATDTGVMGITTGVMDIIAPTTITIL